MLECSGSARPYEKSRPITVSELELTPPGEGELLVRMTAAGVCHSDLSVVNNSRPRPLPMLLGHESAGVVEAVGPGVDDIQPGQHVVMTFLPRCGQCDACETDRMIPCEVGSRANAEGTLIRGTRHLTRGGEVVQHHVGVSGFATHAVVSRNSVVGGRAGGGADIAAIFGCAISTSRGAVLNEIKPRPDDRIAVVGLGGVGMAALITALALNVHEVVGIDMQAKKREKALELGASAAYSPQEAEEAGVRFHAVVEAAGNPRALETAFKVTAPGGITVTVGLPAANSPVTFDALEDGTALRQIIRFE